MKMYLKLILKWYFNVLQLIGYQSSFKCDCRISVNNRMFSQFSEVFLIGKFIYFVMRERERAHRNIDMILPWIRQSKQCSSK